MKSFACGAVVAALILGGCHTITEELPTQPTKTPGVLTIPIPSIPTPAPTPKATPTPGPTPTPTPTPGPTPTPTPTPPPSTGGCGNPLPPPVTRMNTKIHLKGGGRWTLDTTPLVGPDRAYCDKIGLTGRTYCPVRPEGSPDREACEAYAIGKALDTGRNGPTWYKDGQLCTGETKTGCENSEENQYQLWVYVSGHYEACTRDDVCGGVDVVR